MNKIIDYAEKWFQLNDIQTIKAEGRLFISPDGHFELELSQEEILYRAELFLESESEKTK